MEKLLITGSTGFVGRYVVSKALEKDYEIHLIVRNPQKAKNLFSENVRAYPLDDFTKKEELRNILETIKPDFVVHLIGIIQEIKNKGITFEKIHYEYSKSLYEILTELPPKKIIHMSALGVDELAPSKYHITKLKAERELIKTGIPCVILRPSFIIGPEQLLFVKLRTLLNKMPFLIFPDIRNYYFQPVDVRDVAECFIKAIKYDGQGIFELCGEEKLSLKEIIKDFSTQLGKRAFFIPLTKIILKFFAPEQYKMMWRDNICGYSNDAMPIEKILDRMPITYEESIKWTAQP